MRGRGEQHTPHAPFLTRKERALHLDWGESAWSAPSHPAYATDDLPLGADRLLVFRLHLGLPVVADEVERLGEIAQCGVLRILAEAQDRGGTSPDAYSS